MQISDDILSSTLQSLRIHSAVLLREAYAPPWAITIPGSSKLNILLNQKTNARIVAFHIVEKGCCSISSEDETGRREARIEAGQMAICFGGAAHHLVEGAPLRPIALETLLQGGKNPFDFSGNAPEKSVSLLCGVFLMHDVSLNPLFSALPPLLHTSLSTAGTQHNLSGVLSLMQQEMARRTMGSSYVLERLLEILCAQVIRAYAETTPASGANWLTGIRDPVVGNAVGCIHADPAQDWTVARLAEIVSMSPSRFAARFAAALGEPPMTYVTKWRMNVAARLLVNSQKDVAQVAVAAGYNNVPAFHRAFKKHLGMPPVQWRSTRQAHSGTDQLF